MDRWDVMMAEATTGHTSKRERSTGCGGTFQKKHCSTIQSLTVGGSLYESNAPTLIPLARAATHFWRNLRKFVPFGGGNLSAEPSSAGRGDVSKGILRPPAQAD